MPGMLYLVATPIGNLEDMTFRAVRVLKQVDQIACEDTRHARKLLDHYGIQNAVVSLHEHNEAARTQQLISYVQEGRSVALISDAGMPLISDPGYRLVRAALEAGIPVQAIPGPTAAITALAASGLPADAFHFAGFLPPKSAQRRSLLQRLKTEQATLIFYEAPHRILATLQDISAVLGPRPVVLARELTKVHEEYLRGTAAEIHALLAARASIKGEMTLLVAGCAEPAPGLLPAEEEVAARMRQGISRMEAIKQVARDYRLPKRDLYRRMEERKAR